MKPKLPTLPSKPLTYFLGRVRQTPSGCWEWQGARLMSGYGFWTAPGGRRFLVHRVVTAYVYGEPPSPDAHAMHACDNPPCCNPAHLSWGSHADNNHDAWSKGRAISGYAVRQKRKTHCPQGHPYDDANTQISRDGRHRSCRTCHRLRERSRKRRLRQEVDA